MEVSASLRWPCGKGVRGMNTFNLMCSLLLFSCHTPHQPRQLEARGALDIVCTVSLLGQRTEWEREWRGKQKTSRPPPPTQTSFLASVFSSCRYTGDLILTRSSPGEWTDIQTHPHLRTLRLLFPLLEMLPSNISTWLVSSPWNLCSNITFAEKPP